jgi:dsRNA-specific ribonuclease/ERCC4-related helicase
MSSTVNADGTQSPSASSREEPVQDLAATMHIDSAQSAGSAPSQTLKDRSMGRRPVGQQSVSAKDTTIASTTTAVAVSGTGIATAAGAGIVPENKDLDQETPRLYQLELIEAAKRENIIAYLETGAGKTLVAALLIKHVLVSDPDPHKVAMFIVDRVPLAIQQCKYIQRIIKDTGSVGVYYGDMGIETWGESRWLEELTGKKVMCMTAQVFLNALRHGVIFFETVALLVFDEAHHATKSHPFNSIMREFYFPARKAKSPLPRIFGMTASPIKVKGATEQFPFCIKSIQTLQLNLQARVVVVNDASQEAVDACIARPDEFIIKYAPGEAVPPSDLHVEDSNSLLDAVKSEIGLCAFNYVQRHCIASSPETHIAALGDAEWTETITDKVRKLLDLLMDECKRWKSLAQLRTEFRCIVFVERRAVAVALAWLINQAFSAVHEACLNARAVLGIHNTWSACPPAFRMTQAQQNDVLEGFASGQFGIMVATNVVEEGLDVAACGLVVMFNAVSTPKAYIQSRGRARHMSSRYVMMVPESGPDAMFISQCIQKAKDGSNTMLHAVRSLASLKQGNCTGARSETDLAGTYLEDEPSFQSKTTRARVSATAAVNLLYSYCSSLPRDKYIIAGDYWEPKFQVRVDGLSGFLCTVTLPIMCPVKTGECEIPQSSHVKAKRLAALDACKSLYELGALDEHLFPMDYTSRFREVKVSSTGLDESNSIIKVRSSPANPRASKKAKRLRVCNIRPPEVLSWRRSNISVSDAPGELVYVYEILPNDSFSDDSCMNLVVGPCRYGIVTKQRIDKRDLAARKPPTGHPLFVLVPRAQVEISSEQSSLLLKYGRALHNVTVGKRGVMCSEAPPGNDAGEGDVPLADSKSSDAVHDIKALSVFPEPPDRQEDKEYPSRKCLENFNPGFFLVPLLDPLSERIDVITTDNIDDPMDWSAVRDLVGFDEAPWDDICNIFKPQENLNVLQFRLVLSLHDKRHQIYFTGALNSSMQASTCCDEIVGGGRYKTFVEYYRLRHGMDIRDATQPMLEGYSQTTIGRSLNGRRIFYLIPEICRVVPLSPWAVYYIAVLPLWQSFLAIQAFGRQIRLDSIIRFQDFASALQPRVSSAHTERMSYERFEFIGDAVLKALASMTVFQNRPFDHEGLLTSARDRIVCNSFLCNTSQNLELYNVVVLTGSSIRARSWQWFLGSPQEREVVLSEKLLADCVEALIGIHHLSGGMRRAAKFIADMGILNENVNSFSRPFARPSLTPRDNSRDPRLASPWLGEVESIVGYTFCRKELLLEALTHASYTKSKVMSYQRLEFLGDAVIGFVILNGFFHKYPDFPPSELTFLREPALSNELFGRVVIEHGLHKYLWHNSKALNCDIDRITTLLSTEADQVDAAEKGVMPKVLGDMLESIIGAVVADQGMELGALEVIVDRLVGKALDRFANPTTLAKHPVTKIAHAVQAKFNLGPEFEFEWIAKDVELHSIPSETTFGETLDESPSAAIEAKREAAVRCTIRVNGVTIASSFGPNRRKAKRCAAAAALRVIDSLDQACLARIRNGNYDISSRVD